MPVRLTFLITDLDRGGCPLLLAALAPGLAARGWDVDVVSIAPAGEIATLLKQRDVPVSSLNAAGPWDARVIARFAHHLRRRQPDLVVSLLIHANLLAVLARPFVTRPVVWVQCLHTVQEKPRWHWYVQGVLCSFADGFIAPAQAVVQKLQAFGPVPRPHVIPNGIDVPRFRDALPLPAAQRPWPADACVVGYVGRFDPVKRLPLLVRAMRLLPASMHLALVGYGKQEDELRQLTHDAGLSTRVHFVGPSREPERWLKSFDLFCSPSAAEAFPLTYAEAACAGLPLVVCRTPAIAEVVAQANWLPPDCTEMDIAAAISSMTKDLRSYQGPCCDASIYSQERMIDRYHQSLIALLPEKST